MRKRKVQAWKGNGNNKQQLLLIMPIKSKIFVGIIEQKAHCKALNIDTFLGGIENA
jgi:hypothetical protein